MLELLTNPNVYRSRQRFLFAFRKLVANISTLDEGAFDKLIQSGAQQYQEILFRRKAELIDKTEPPNVPLAVMPSPLQQKNIQAPPSDIIPESMDAGDTDES